MKKVSKGNQKSRFGQLSEAAFLITQDYLSYSKTRSGSLKSTMPGAFLHMNREILRLAIPNILSNISVPLLSSFDTYLMGGLGPLHIAAIGLGSMAFNFVYWNCGFLRMAGTGLTAQAYGRKDEQEMAGVLARGLLVGGVLAALFVLLQTYILQGTEALLDIQADQRSLVSAYFYIRIWAAPAALGLMVLFGWFFGMQNAVFPLILTLLINVVNMGLSYYMVHHLDWGVSGVAWGTVIAQYVGVLAGAGLLAWRYGWVIKGLRSTRILVRDKLFDFLRLNGDILVRTICLTLSFALFYNWANGAEATAVVAANVILLQLINWMSYGVDGFAFAAESLVGKYFGAQSDVFLSDDSQNHQKEKLLFSRGFHLRKSIQLSFVWGMGLAIIYALIYWLLGGRIVEWFAPAEAAPEALAAARSYLPLISVFCLLATPCYIYDGVFVGLTAARALRDTMLLAFAGYLLTYFLWGQYYGNWGLWITLTAFMVYRTIFQFLWMKPLMRRTTSGP
ncbi:MAG: MATE family efflux transporter [Bacteroidota bacterium]